MLVFFLVPIWYGYMAYKQGRNVFGWAILGIVIFIVLKFLTILIASNMDIASNTNIASHNSALDLSITSTLILLGLTFFGALLIPKKLKEENETICTYCKTEVILENIEIEKSEFCCPTCGQLNKILKSDYDNHIIYNSMNLTKMLNKRQKFLRGLVIFFIVILTLTVLLFPSRPEKNYVIMDKNRDNYSIIPDSIETTLHQPIIMFRPIFLDPLTFCFTFGEPDVDFSSIAARTYFGYSPDYNKIAFDLWTIFIFIPSILITLIIYYFKYSKKKYNS